MSLVGGANYGPHGGFPRVSGDEPDHRKNTSAHTRFSPRERG